MIARLVLIVLIGLTWSVPALASMRVWLLHQSRWKCGMPTVRRADPTMPG